MLRDFMLDIAQRNVHHANMNTEQIRIELQALKLADVAKLAGVHRNTLSNIKAGQGRLMTDTADKIAAAIATLKRKKK